MYKWTKTQPQLQGEFTPVYKHILYSSCWKRIRYISMV